MSIQQLLDQLDEALHNPLANQLSNEKNFETLAGQLAKQPELDNIFGGLFQSQTRHKNLATNSRLAGLFTLAANMFANADYARIALQTLGYLKSFHQLDNGFYASQSQTSNSIITIEALKSNLDHSQWQAIKCYFDLPSQGDLDWTSLPVKHSRTEIPQLTDLHPKQVPLALDGALQILQFQLTPPEAQSNWTIDDNILLCRSLYLAGIYLNQQEKAEIAERLLHNLLEHDNVSDSSLWLDVLLLSLRHNWNDVIYSRAVTIYEQLLTTDSSSSSANYNKQLMQQLVTIVENHSQPNDQIFDSEPLFQGVIVITGPAHICRQWLQQMDNQVQYKYRFFARPDNGPIQAQLYPVSGTPIVYTELEELYSLYE